MSAEDRAALLASLPDGELPGFMVDDAFKLELEIWKELSSDLRKINALARLDRYAFAMYCVHMADWITATLDIKKRGATYKARNTINKDVLHKMNPMVRVREIAERHILEIGARFGLDPMNRFKLIAAEALGGGQGNLPFGDPVPPADQDKAQATGFLANNASPVPRPN